MWCSCITPAQHAGGPEFKPQHVHLCCSTAATLLPFTTTKLLKRGGSGARIVEAAILFQNFKKLRFQRVVAVSFGMLVVSTWFPRGFPVVSMWFPSRFQVVCTWFPSGLQVARAWFPSGLYVVSKWFPRGFQVASTWFPFGFQVVSMWFPSGFHVVPICLLWLPCDFGQEQK